MPRLRTVLAVLAALTMAFMPVIGHAMAKSCAMTTSMSDAGINDDGTMNCPCHQSMPDCGAMPQCQTASGCASQCLSFCGTVPVLTGLRAPDHQSLKMRGDPARASLSIRPPSPPPRA